MIHTFKFIILIGFVLISACNQKKKQTNESQDINWDPFSQNIKLGEIKPKHSSEITGSYWSIQARPSEFILQKASELGVKWTRLDTHWEQIEKEKGVYDWQETDKVFESVLRYGITPFVTIGNGNRIYSGTGKYDDPKEAAIYGESPAPPVGSPEEMEAWLNFVEEMINRYKDKIVYWEIWNEPNHQSFWGATPNGKDYGRLVKVTADKIRSIQPDAKIIAGATAGLHPDYNDDFLSQCDPLNIDIISFHHYSALPENRIYLIDKFQEVLNKYNPKLEIWQGESGYPSHSRTTGFRASSPWGLNIQAKWLLRQSFVDTYFCRATLSSYFLLANSGRGRAPDLKRRELTGIDTILGYPERGGSRVHSGGENQKCLLFGENQQPKPAYYAYQNLCSAMDDSYKVFQTKYEFQVIHQGHFYGIGEYEDAFPSVPLLASYKTADGKAFVAYWLPWKPQENVLELAIVNVSIDNISYEDPVLLDLLTGKIYKIDEFKVQDTSIIFYNLPLADYPMAIVERRNINF
jgi:hypothetical protein